MSRWEWWTSTAFSGVDKHVLLRSGAPCAPSLANGLIVTQRAGARWDTYVVTQRWCGIVLRYAPPGQGEALLRRLLAEEDLRAALFSAMDLGAGAPAAGPFLEGLPQ